MEKLKDRLKKDAQKAKRMLNEQIAAVEYYSKIAWSALKKPLMGLGMAAILSSCGFTKNQAKETAQDTKEKKTEQVVRHKEVQLDQAVKNNGHDYGYDDPNEVVETQEEKEAREAEEGFWEIMEGKQTHGNAGTDKVNYGKPGKGAPSRLTKEEAEAMYRVKSKIGRGMDNVDMDELDKKVRDRVSGNSRDLSWEQVVKDAGYGR